MKPAFHRTSSPARQRGISAVMVGFYMFFVAVPLLALMVNVGQLHYAQRDLQKLATLAAYDAARVESGCFSGGSGVGGTSKAALTAAQNTLTAANNTNILSITPSVQLGKLDTTTTPGRRIFTAATSDNDPSINAVQVTLTAAPPATLVPLFTSGGTLTATAAAEHAPMVSFHIGTAVASISANSPLNAMLTKLLGSNISLSLADYQSLASANVTLLGLENSLGIGDASTLLNTQLSLGTLLTGIANAAGATGQTTAASLLSTLASAASSLGGINTSLGQVLNLESGAAGEASLLSLNALQLLTDLALSANNGLYPISLPVQFAVGSLAGLKAYLQVGSVPATASQSDQGTAAGRPGFNATTGLPHTQAQTQQVTFKLRLYVNNSGLLGSVVQIKLGADIVVAQATSYLSSILCPSAGSTYSSQPTVSLSTTLQPVSITLGSFDPNNLGTDVELEKNVTSGSLLNVLLGTLSIQLANPLPNVSVGATGPVTTSFNGPFPQTQTVGSMISLDNTVSGLSSTLASGLTVKVLGIALPSSGVTSLASSLISPLVGVLDSVVNPLLNFLGVQVGAATLIVDGLDYQNEAGRNVKFADTSSGTQPSIFNQQKSGEVGGGTTGGTTGSTR